MKKSMLLVMVVLFAVSAHAQDDQGTRSLSVYVCGGTGNMTQAPGYEKNDPSRLFKDNGTEFGMVYNQSFANGLGFNATVLAGGRATVDWQDISDDQDGSKQQMTVDGYTANPIPRAKLGLTYGINGFSTYLSLDTRLLMAFGLGYSMSFGNAGSLALGTDVEFFTGPKEYLSDTVMTGYGSKPTDVYKDYTKEVTNVAVGMIDLFQIHVAYTVPFAERWAFNTKAMFRFGSGGVSDDMRAVGLAYADVNAFAFGNTFFIRWDNTLSVKATDNLSFWGRVRYQAYNIAQKTPADDGDKWVAADVDHRVSLHAGMTYKFNF